MSYRVKFLLQASQLSLSSQSEDGVEEPEVQPQSPQRPQPKPDAVRPTQSGQQVNQFQDVNSVCGVPVAGFTQSLVIGGEAAGRGEW